MKRIVLILATAILTAVVTISPIFAGSEVRNNFSVTYKTNAANFGHNSRFIVSFNQPVNDSQIKEYENKYALSFLKQSKKGINQYLIKTSDIDKLKEFAKQQKIRFVEPDSEVSVMGQVADWGIDSVKVPSVWNRGLTGAGITIAVIDTGVELTHPDLVGQVLSTGYDFINNDADPTDDTGHGTHVAGIIAALNNDIGGVGVAYDTKILPIKVLGADGQGTMEALAQGIYYAVDHGVNIINLSLGALADSQAVADALDYARVNNVVVIAAAGNYGRLSGCVFPANYFGVVCVGALNADNTVPTFSGNGMIYAPGVQVTSTFLNGTYKQMEGTSMAAPYVSGSVALIMQSCQFCSREVILDKLYRGAEDLGEPGVDSEYNYGKVNPLASIDRQMVEIKPLTTKQTVPKGSVTSTTFTVSNKTTESIWIDYCSIYGLNTWKAGTKPYASAQKAQIGDIVSTPIATYDGLGDIAHFFSIPIGVGESKEVSWSYTVTPDVLVNQNAYIIATCHYGRKSSEYLSETLPSDYVTTKVTEAVYPDTLKNVYFTFWKFKYGNYVSPSAYRVGDNISLKNYDPKKLSVLSISLYDYTTKGNQCYARTWKNATTIYLKSCGLLPAGRKFAVIFKFKDNATSLVKTMYFVTNTVRPGYVSY